MAEAGVLLAEVRAVKTMGRNHFVLVDAGFNELMRPSMYGSHHGIQVLAADQRNIEEQWRQFTSRSERLGADRNALAAPDEQRLLNLQGQLAAANDAADSVIYVSPRSGEVLVDTTRFERGWNWIGTVLHWIYFTPLRSGGDSDTWRWIRSRTGNRCGRCSSRSRSVSARCWCCGSSRT